MPAVVACGTRRQAFDSFCAALNKGDSELLPLLLVDSEAPVSGSPWEHLQREDSWRRPQNCSDEHAQLMVQCMEAWFLADKDALLSFYGSEFRRDSLPQGANVEKIAKMDVINALKRATRDCSGKGSYHKGRHSYKILALVNPESVANSSAFGRRLIQRVKSTPQ
jgi:hypothetical protein